jgi:hypothetical protein
LNLSHRCGPNFQSLACQELWDDTEMAEGSCALDVERVFIEAVFRMRCRDMPSRRGNGLLAQQGERDPKRLVAGVLIRLKL